jgi:hypothetical protein
VCLDMLFVALGHGSPVLLSQLLEEVPEGQL